MTIRDGHEWGTTVDRPADTVTAKSDAELSRLVSGDRSISIRLSGGDVFRTLGSPGSRDLMQCLPIDLLHVVIDDRNCVAVAHVIARRSWWRGPILAVMNADHLGDWIVAPRGHLNDGRFDVLEVSATMSIRQRFIAKGRLSTGTHIPHPAITSRTARTQTWEFVEPMRVWIDGVARGRVERLTVTIEPDAFVLYV